MRRMGTDMKPNLLLLFAIIFVTEILSAQIPSVSESNSPAQAASANVLAPGTLLSVELSKSLDAKKLKPNDKFEARTALDLLSHGQIVIPRNTRIIGRVTDAKAHSKQSPDSLLGIAFERVMLKDGRELPLQAAVQAIARPLQTSPPVSNNEDDPMGASASGVPPSPGQRGTRIGTPAGGTPVPDPSGYPVGGGSGLPPDPNNPNSSTVSPLGPTSKGIVGIKGLSLESTGTASIVTSKTDNVRLSSGTQLILRVQ